MLEDLFVSQTYGKLEDLVLRKQGMYSFCLLYKIFIKEKVEKSFFQLFDFPFFLLLFLSNSYGHIDSFGKGQR